MEVILLEHVRNLGHLGDKVTIKAGYGRNYLIPKSKAVFATPKNIFYYKTLEQVKDKFKSIFEKYTKRLQRKLHKLCKGWCKSISISL